MTTRTVLRSMTVALLACVAVACGSGSLSTPTAPSGAGAISSPSPAPLPPIPTSPFPDIVRPARVYAYADPVTSAVHEWTESSRFVLYDDHTFALQFIRSRGSFEYAGRYREMDGAITFDWDGWSTAGPWGATATIQGDVLSVRYNVIMQLSDFEDASYRRTASAPAP